MIAGARPLMILGTLLLVPLGAACNDTTSFDAITPPPSGVPAVYGWDGVDGRMMMMFPDLGQYGDPIAWTLHGSTWTRSPAPPTTNVEPMLLAYDSTRDRVVVVIAAPSLPPQTWEWDGHAWKNVETAHSLPDSFRAIDTAAYSPELHAVVSFQSGLGDVQHTYLYDGTDWRDLVTADGPPSIERMEYDPIRHRIVAFSEPDYHTWLFDGVSWTALPLPPAATPDLGFVTGRQSPASALDERTDRWVIFGGFDGSRPYDDTWVGDGSTWNKVSPPASPSAREGARLAWDPTTGRLDLFGGDTMGNGLLRDTWTWDGASWSRLS